MKLNFHRGFTLIELLVVVAIIGTLAAIGTLAYNGYVGGAKQSAATNAMQQIALQEQEYDSINGSYFIQAACTPDDDTVDEINSDLFDADEDEPVVELDGYRICVDSHVTGFEVKACKWNATDEVCKDGEEILTLNTKGGRNF